MFVLDKNNVKLYDGSRQACKHYIRQNRLSSYILTESYNEKVIETGPIATPYVPPMKTEEKKETFFSKIFS
jgi:hypothetical protein